MLRSARRDGRQVHLLAAMDHATRTVFAQRQVNGATGDAHGSVVTAIAGTARVITSAALS